MPSTYKRPGSRLWQIRYLDRTGRKRSISSGYTDKRAAEALAREVEDRERRIRQGILSASEADAIEAARLPVRQHLDEHLASARINERHRHWKRVLLDGFITAERIETLAQIDARSVSRHMTRLTDSEGLSARTANAFRAAVLRFLNWCVEDRRLPAAFPGRSIAKRNEDTDRRRLRRPFTEEELDRLFAHIGEAPRADAYRLALLTGLRRSELAALLWSDVDVDSSEPCLRLRATATKAKRSEEVPLHRDAVGVLRRLRDTHGDEATGRVLPELPTVYRLYRDLADAGVQGIDKRNAVPDASGRIIDFHSFRATLATLLAKRGVAPLHLKRLMRHASVETTDKHYTGLRLHDLGRELDRLGPVGSTVHRTVHRADAEPLPSVRTGAPVGANGRSRERRETPAFCGVPRVGAPLDAKRETGLEPATFSLGSCASELENTGFSAHSEGDCTPECTPDLRRSDLAKLVAMLAELPPESIGLLVDLAKRLGGRSSATG